MYDIKQHRTHHQPSLLTCEGSGKREALDGVSDGASDGAGAWRLVSLEGWRNSASELYVYLAGQRERNRSRFLQHAHHTVGSASWYTQCDLTLTSVSIHLR